MSNRLDKLTQVLNSTGIESFLVSSPSNIFYLTGFRGLAPWERECFLLFTDKSWFFITDARYEKQTRAFSEVQTVTTDQGQNYYQKITQLLKNDKLYFEYRDLKYLEFEYLQRINTQLVMEPQDGLVEKLRVVKDSQDLQALKQACNITDQVFSSILETPLVGKTEAEVSFLIESLSHSLGGEGTSFIPIVATGLNSALSHHRPDRSRITGGPLFLDFGVKYAGYTSDITRTIWIDEKSRVVSLPPGEAGSGSARHFQETHKKVLEAQQTAISTIQPGMTGKEAYECARVVLAKYDLAQYFHHSLGHGVGIDIHENPRLSSLSNMILEPNMVFTVEPGVYIPNKFGIQIEDTVLLTEKGCTLLTKSKKDFS